MPAMNHRYSCDHCGGYCEEPPHCVTCRNSRLSQPRPKPTRQPPVWDLVKADMAARDEKGMRKYGVRLQPGNGRDALVDLYQELLDAVAYTRQLMFERDGR